MNNMKKIISIAGIIGLLLSTVLVMGDDDDDRYERGEYNKKYEKYERDEYKKYGKYDRDEKYKYKKGKMFSKRPDVAPVKNAAYREECGSCHFAYQPGLLPARSWQKMMANLENHFEENAELDQETQTSLTRYLVTNAADKANYKRSIRIMNSLRNNARPLRVTETPYFIRKHDEIPRRMVQNNPEVGSFSKCAACHTNAEKGYFDDDDVFIPGVGRWDDD